MNARLEALLHDTRDLVSLPEVYLEVKRTIESPTNGASDVAHAISKDPALVAKFLRIANSAVYAPTSEIATVSRAVAMLGTQLVHDIVLAASVASVFTGVRPDVMDVRKFWSRSVECGVLAKTIAGHIGVLDSEHVFIEGLLADIGHMVLFMNFPEQMQRIAERSAASGALMHNLEMQEFGFDYCTVGSRIAGSWGLPEALETVIGTHQHPGEADAYELEVSIVHIAYRLSGGAAGAIPELDSAAVAATDCGPDVAAGIRTGAQETIRAATTTFGSLAVPA